MSEAECRRWIADTIEWLRARKARPDLERICQAVQRRHGVSPSRTRRQLDRLLRARAVLRVSYKGSQSYRNAAPGPPQPGAGPAEGPGRSGRAAGGSARDRSTATRAPSRDKPREQPSLVVTRARHKEVLEQQVARARSRKPPAAERRRRVTDIGPERKKTRRTREADPSESEGSDEEKVVPPKDQESVGQVPIDTQNGAVAVTDCGSEEGDAGGSPIKSPATEAHPVEDIGEELPIEEQPNVSSAVEQSPPLCPSDEHEDVAEAELTGELEEHEGVEVRLCPVNTGEAGSFNEPGPMEEVCANRCSQEPGVHQGSTPHRQMRNNLKRAINLHVFGMWEETGAPGGNPRGHRENVQTPHRQHSMSGLNPEL